MKNISMVVWYSIFTKTNLVDQNVETKGWAIELKNDIQINTDHARTNLDLYTI